MEKARIHIYCGDGKGKTTAAIGLSVRSCGRGWPVVLSQFLKGSTSGELNVLRNLPNYHYVEAPTTTCKFVFQMGRPGENGVRASRCASTLPTRWRQ